MKVLNLYSGIGGNRKLWKDVDVTAVEYNEEIAAIYKEYFPDDKVIVADAHEYLLKHYKEFDFIWSSPPCKTHSRMNKATRHPERRYFDARLWQEIVFLKEFFNGKWTVENVIPYYEPLIKPSAELQRHYFWTNFNIYGSIEIDNVKGFIQSEDIKAFEEYLGIKVNWKVKLLERGKYRDRTAQVLRNCVHPELGLYILEQAQGIIRQEKVNQISLFNNDAA